MESFSAIGVFVRVADTRSLVNAAQQIGISASAVGKAIARLERHLGVRLFHRNTRSMTLTAEGHLFLKRSRRILHQIEAAESELSLSSTVPSGRLRISMPLVSDPFLPALADFQALHPRIDLELDFTDRKVDLIEEGVDVVVRGGQTDDSGLHSRWLGRFRMVLVAAPSYLAIHGTPRSPDDLIEHTTIQFRFPSTGKLQAWPGLAPDQRFRRAPIVCSTLEARRAFAVRGIGVTYLPDFAITDELAYGRLVPVLPDFSDGGGAFRLMWPATPLITPKLKAFIDYFPQHVPFDRSESARHIASLG
jgi:DNA-binding transcriptional LysR family regulator